MTTNTERHPDIEIYAAAIEPELIFKWLNSLGQLDSIRTRKGITHARLRILATEIPVVLVERACEGFTSIWFDSAETPWHNDLACAREAAKSLQTEIRCISGGWNEGDDPDEWWQINSAGETIIHWRSEDA